MTDLEAFTEMLDRAGVVSLRETTWNEGLPLVVITTEGGEKNLGYRGFNAQFAFDKDGALDSVGVWE